MNTIENLDSLLCELAEVTSDIKRFSRAVRPEPVEHSRIAAVQNEGLASVAKRLLAELLAREDYVPGFAVSEPVWLILLDLYIHAVAGRNVMMGEICIAARVPQTTGLRYVSTLVAQGWVERGLDPTDRRRTLVQLTERGFTSISRYLASVAENRARFAQEHWTAGSTRLASIRELPEDNALPRSA
jgi:DNA-binding MarR family transcriptional regulator